MTEPQKAKTTIRSLLVRRVQLGVISLLLVGIAALAMAIVYQRTGPGANQQASYPDRNGVQAFDGPAKIDPPLEMPDFTLRNQFSEATSLSDLRGQYVLMTFGFTNCPDVCPLTLNEFRRVRDSLGSSREKVAFVFISVDGERDTPAALRNYFALRELDGIIGLTGEKGAIQALGVDYGLSFEMTGPDQRGGYLVNHTAGSFLLDQYGRWIKRYQFGVPPSAIVGDLKALLSS